MFGKATNFDQLYRALSRHSGGFVIAVHEISPDRLAEVVECLHPGRLVSLTEIVRRCKAGKPTNGLFAVTVDDGVGETVRSLSNFFGAKGWPINFYLPTNYLDSGRAMSFQSWARLKPLLSGRRLTLRSGEVDFSRRETVEAIERMWYCQRPESYVPLIQELLEIVARETGLPLTQIQGPEPISWGEVAELSRNDLFQFESHGVLHCAMSALTEDQILYEMRRSREIVELHTGRPCRHLSYPFGSDLSIGTLAPKLAPRVYDSATTMSLGSVDRSNPWRLPRIPIYGVNSLWYARMKVLLTCTTILNGNSSNQHVGDDIIVGWTGLPRTPSSHNQEG